jgi:hypothetical protein
VSAVWIPSCSDQKPTAAQQKLPCLFYFKSVYFNDLGQQQIDNLVMHQVYLALSRYSVFKPM